MGPELFSYSEQEAASCLSHMARYPPPFHFHLQKSVPSYLCHFNIIFGTKMETSTLDFHTQVYHKWSGVSSGIAFSTLK